MAKTIFIIHDSFGGPLQDWIPWLRMTMEQAGHRVIVPNFPTPIGQSRDSWHVVIENNLKYFGPDTIVIGFGTGGTCWLRELENFEREAFASIFVATPITPSPHVGYAKANESFVRDAFNWKTIASRGGAKAVFSGGDDQLCATDDGDLLALNLGVESMYIGTAGHFTVGSGYTQFVQLADLINRLISPQPIEATPVAETKEEAPAGLEKPSSLSRSYYSDMATAMKENKGNVMGSVLRTAREKRETMTAQNPTQPRNIMYGIMGLVLLVLGAIGLGYAVFSIIPESTPTPQGNQLHSSLIRKESETIIDLTNLEGYQAKPLVAKEAEKTGAELTINETIFTGSHTRLSFADTYTKVTEQTLRNTFSPYLNDTWMYGHWYRTSSPTISFIILSVKSYDGIFSGLRSWEPTLPQDLGRFFNLPDSVIHNSNNYSWTDVLVQNRALRKLIVAPTKSVVANTLDKVSEALGTTADDGPNLYSGFLSDSLLVITTDPVIFNELSRRLSDQQFLK